MYYNNQVMPRGGKRQGAGRPKLPEQQEVRTPRLSDRLWHIFKKMGGTKWLRTTLTELEKGENKK